jgi:hypothetical protein
MKRVGSLAGLIALNSQWRAFSIRLGRGRPAILRFLNINKGANPSQQHVLTFTGRGVDYFEYRERRPWWPNDRKVLLMRPIMPYAVAAIVGRWHRQPVFFKSVTDSPGPSHF